MEKPIFYVVASKTGWALETYTECWNIGFAMKKPAKFRNVSVAVNIANRINERGAEGWHFFSLNIPEEARGEVFEVMTMEEYGLILLQNSEEIQESTPLTRYLTVEDLFADMDSIAVYARSAKDAWLAVDLTSGTSKVWKLTKVARDPELAEFEELLSKLLKALNIAQWN